MSFVLVDRAQAELKVLIIAELKIAPKGLQSLWYGVGHHDLLFSIIYCVNFPEHQEKMTWSLKGIPLYITLRVEENVCCFEIIIPTGFVLYNVLEDEVSQSPLLQGVCTIWLGINRDMHPNAYCSEVT